MRFKRHPQIQNHLEQIHIAPLVNAIFLLLIFFMLTNSFSLQPGVNVLLPRAITSDILREENFTITITGENVIYLNNKIITIKELSRELQRPASQKRSILIKADRRSSVGRIVDVWDLCRDSGIEKINIATDQEK